MGLRGAEGGVRRAVTARGGGGGDGGGARNQRLPPAPAAPRAGPAARLAAPAAVPGGAGATLRRSRPAPLFAVPPLPGSRAWPPEVRAIKSSAERRRRRRRQERRRQGQEDSEGLAGAGSPCPAWQRGEPTGPARRRREAGGGGGAGLAAARKPGERELDAARRRSAAAAPPSPNPAPSRRGSRRREEAAESPLQRSRAAAAARIGAAGGAASGAPAPAVVPGQPELERGGGAATTALRRCGAGRAPDIPNLLYLRLPGTRRDEQRPGGRGVREGLNPAAAPGQGEGEAPRVSVPSCGFWGPSGVGGQRDTPQEGPALPCRPVSERELLADSREAVKVGGSCRRNRDTASAAVCALMGTPALLP
ncbi:collagen alpha-1(I) chain-like [Haemorhous mexicanus]|uniref:collagen alpha-1(I) chain-like n=1 Tax=Haemorhous mexicanus TaxID=30427 RepID=UPI0028BE5DCC|nr:collagen alpha-1(I) chain-like [Haemorhous mexicanus]